MKDKKQETVKKTPGSPEIIWEPVTLEEDIFAEPSTLSMEELLAFILQEARDRDDYFVEEPVTEEDIAWENGFWIDDDGHWQELEHD